MQKAERGPFAGSPARLHQAAGLEQWQRDNRTSPVMDCSAMGPSSASGSDVMRASVWMPDSCTPTVRVPRVSIWNLVTCLLLRTKTLPPPEDQNCDIETFFGGVCSFLPIRPLSQAHSRQIGHQRRRMTSVALLGFRPGQCQASQPRRPAKTSTFQPR